MNVVVDRIRWRGGVVEVVRGRTRHTITHIPWSPKALPTVVDVVSGTGQGARREAVALAERWVQR